MDTHTHTHLFLHFSHCMLTAWLRFWPTGLSGLAYKQVVSGVGSRTDAIPTWFHNTNFSCDNNTMVKFEIWFRVSFLQLYAKETWQFDFLLFQEPIIPARENLLPLTEAVVLFSNRMLINSKLMIFHTDPTEATYRHYLIIDGQSISLDVMDTAGKVGFKFKNSNFCLVFLFILNVLLSLCLQRLCRKSMSCLAFTILK